ncbi:hypothetical protein BKA69DRAFT_151668 [Paraphysoderma sedebokerense]|nr:hypothetical protein BKA69DRAFT_151668 [Paraphysoderma sedebokerense]
MTIPSHGITMKYYFKMHERKAYFGRNNIHSVRELFETVIQFKDSPPIATFFNEYMDGLINSNQSTSTFDTFQNSKSLSVNSDINILAKTYISVGNILSAYDLFRSLPSQYPYLRANAITYTTLITG